MISKQAAEMQRKHLQLQEQVAADMRLVLEKIGLSSVGSNGGQHSGETTASDKRGAPAEPSTNSRASDSEDILAECEDTG